MLFVHRSLCMYMCTVDESTKLDEAIMRTDDNNMLKRSFCELDEWISKMAHETLRRYPYLSICPFTENKENLLSNFESDPIENILKL